MSEPSTGLLSRITRLFGPRRSRLGIDGVPLGEPALDEHGNRVAPRAHLVDTRVHSGGIFRPWVKRDAALQNLSEGFVTLTQLMSGIKENLEKQNLRHDELARLLSALPQAIESIPETNRSQAEALRTIYQQLAQQNQAQSTLGEVLNRIVDGAGQQRQIIDQLGDQLDSLRRTDATISDNLATVGTAMSSLSQTSQTSAQVLERVQASLSDRDRAISELLHRQNQRFNLIFWASIVLAITTLLSLAMLTYLLVRPS
jgi:chromosome segregation ATPase